MKKFNYLDYNLGEKPHIKIKELCSFLKKNKVHTILDYHCGKGRNSIYLAKYGFDVSSLEFSFLLDKLERLIKKEKINITLLKLNNDKDYAILKGRKFDAIIAWRVLHRGRDKERVKELNRLNQLLLQSGFLIITISSERDIKPDSKRRPHKEIEERTFEYISKGVKNIRHYFTRKEILKIAHIHNLKILFLQEIKEKTGHISNNYLRNYWLIIAQKNIS